MAEPLFTIDQVSENSLLVRFGEPCSTDLSLFIARCGDAVLNHFGDQLLNSIPSYNALLVTFQPWSERNFPGELQNVLADLPRNSRQAAGEVIEIPAWYDAEVAEYMEEILADTGCSLEELITLHTAQPFFVYMIGFCPGFAYMGDLPEKLRLPRRKTPQLKIPAGSVAIADFQTAIYPLEMPGGWHIIGRTPLTVFDASRARPSLLQQGDMVQFKAISRKEFLDLGGVL